MKTLTLKQYKLKDGSPISTVQLVETVLNKPQEGGFKIAEMKLRLAVQDKLDTVDKEALKLEEQTLELEDAEVVKLKELAKDYPWGIADRAIIDFDEVVNQL